MSSVEYRHKLDEFCKNIRELNKRISLYEEKIQVFKQFENLSLWDNVFQSRPTTDTNRRLRPTKCPS